MNSWEILKYELTEDTMSKTVGYTRNINKAAKIFIMLRNVLNDYEIAVKAFNADKEVGEAIMQKGFLNNLKESGILS